MSSWYIWYFIIASSSICSLALYYKESLSRHTPCPMICVAYWKDMLQWSNIVLCGGRVEEVACSSHCYCVTGTRSLGLSLAFPANSPNSPPPPDDLHTARTNPSFASFSQSRPTFFLASKRGTDTLAMARYKRYICGCKARMNTASRVSGTL